MGISGTCNPVISAKITPSNGWRATTVYLTSTKYICKSEDDTGSTTTLVHRREKGIRISWRVLSQPEHYSKSAVESSEFVRKNISEEEWALVTLENL